MVYGPVGTGPIVTLGGPFGAGPVGSRDPPPHPEARSAKQIPTAARVTENMRPPWKPKAALLVGRSIVGNCERQIANRTALQSSPPRSGNEGTRERERIRHP